MKTFPFTFAVVAALLSMASCSNDDAMLDIDPSTAPETTASTSNIRSVDEAINLASQAADWFSDPQSRSTGKSISGKHSVQVLGQPSSRSGAATDTLLYIVNYDNNQGFAIIAAPRQAEPLIGYVEEGEFDAFDAANSENFSFYLDAATNYASSTITPSTDLPLTPIPKTEESTQFHFEIIPSKLATKWGQRYPEGQFCKNGFCGCGQLALAQAMSWLEIPSSIALTYEDRDKDSQNLNWTALKTHIQSIDHYSDSRTQYHLEDCQASEETHKALGRLCRQLGQLTNADYSAKSVTVSYNSDVRSVAKQIFEAAPYNKEVSEMTYLFGDLSYDTFYNQLKDGIGIIFGTQQGQSVGHAWVVDGGIQQGTITYTYALTYENGVVVKRELISTRKNLKTYFHFDWGWWGRYKGYFLAGVFDPAQPSNIVLNPDGESEYEGDASGIGSLDRNVHYFVIKQ